MISSPPRHDGEPPCMRWEKTKRQRQRHQAHTGRGLSEVGARVVVVDGANGQTQAGSGVLPTPRLGVGGCVGAYQSSGSRATDCDGRCAEDSSRCGAKHGGREGGKLGMTIKGSERKRRGGEGYHREASGMNWAGNRRMGVDGGGRG